MKNDDVDIETRTTEWIDDGKSQELLTTAISFGAKLKRVGSAEHVGPCPCDGGTDTLGVNTSKRAWICRRGGAKGRDAVSLAMHLAGLGFVEAVEALTGRPSPRGTKARPLSQEEKDEREQIRLQRAREQQARDAALEAEREMSAAEAKQVWDRETVDLAGTGGEIYLRDARKIAVPPQGWPGTLRFHRGLYHRIARQKYPALVSRIQDISGETIAIHAIFLDGSNGFHKIRRDDAKLTYGPMKGGAVRLYGCGPRLEVGEGLETMLAVGWLSAFKNPLWACLSTSGLRGLELPLEVERVRLWPDGDLPMKKVNGEFVPTRNGAGVEAGLALQERLREIGVDFTMNAVPNDRDYLDVYNAIAAMEAA